MTLPREEWHLDTRYLGQRVLIFDCLDSTNNYAASLAHDTANDGLVVAADAQIAGRGQHGRTWHSTPGQGILLSVLLFPPPALRRPVLLAAWAAVAVCETIIQATGLEPRIKWPNDVFVQGRKVCGILIEQGRGTVAGVGLNVNQAADVFATAGLPEAGSLASLTQRDFDLPQITRLLILHLDTIYSHLCAGNLSAVETTWRERIGLLGQDVFVECQDGDYRGELRTVSFDLVELLQAEGLPLRLKPESVRHLFAV